MPRRRAEAVVAVCIRVPIPVEQRRRKLMEELDLDTPALFDAALRALEAQIASEAAEPIAAE
jgi:hypothetical protein